MSLGPLARAEPDVLAYMTFPKEHRAKLHSTNPIERLKRDGFSWNLTSSETAFEQSERQRFPIPCKPIPL